MFWDTVLNGFKILLEWKIWVVIFIYSGIMHLNYRRFIHRVALANIYSTNSEAETNRQMDSFTIIKSITDSALVVVSIFILLPILLGEKSFSSFSNLKEVFWIMIIIILITTGARIILSRFGSNKSALTKGGTHITFFICVFVISFIMHRIVAELPVSDIPNVFPSFWLCTGFVFISYFILLISSFGLGLILIPLSKETKEYVMNSIVTGGVLVLGIVYMRMYCYHIIEKVSEININWDAI